MVLASLQLVSNLQGKKPSFHGQAAQLHNGHVTAFKGRSLPHKPQKKRAPLRKNPHPRHGGAHGRLATASSQGPRHSANSGRGMRTPGAHPGTQTGSPAELRPGHHGTSVTSSSSSCPLVPHGRKHATTHCIPVSTIKKTILFHLATLPPYGAMTCCPNPFQPNLPLVALHLPRCPVQISR